MSRFFWFILLISGLTLLLLAQILGVVRRQKPHSAWRVYALSENGNYEIYRTGGSGRKNLTHHPASDSFPLWSPTGMWIVFISDRDGNFEIYRAHPNSWRVLNLSNTPHDDKFPQWSPDGEWIAYEAWTGSDHEVFRVRPDGRGQQNLSQNPANDWFPRWSSEGAWIIFQSTRSEMESTYQMSPDGEQVETLLHESSIFYSSQAAPVINLPWKPAYPFFTGIFCLAAAVSWRVVAGRRWLRQTAYYLR